MKKPRLIRERLEAFLRSRAPEEYNAKAIALAINAKPSSIRKELSRAVSDPSSGTIRSHKGFYRAKTDLDVLRKVTVGKPIMLHGIKLEGQILNENTRVSFEAVANPKPSPGRFRRRNYYQETWEGRSVKITFHDSGFIEIWCNSGENPLTYGAFDRFRSWLEGRFPREDIGKWQIKQVDLNVDVRELNLMDVKHLRLHTFRNAWLNLYQKQEDILRFEVSMTPKELKLDEACMILKALVDIPTKSTYEPIKPDDKDYTYG